MPNLRVAARAHPLHQAWDRFVESHPGAGIYHSLAWQRVTEQGFGHRSTSLCAIDRGGTVQGVLPLFEVRGIFGRRLVSVPMQSSPASAARATSSLKGLHPLPPGCTDADWQVNRGWVTTQVDLTPGQTPSGAA